MTRISIAMATYNGARFLDEQLRSLVGQRLRPFELVVADDGSTDDTLAQIRAFAAHAPFPVVIIEGQGRLGYRLNFRRAAQHCSGDIIAFCDQDDIWREDKLEVMAKCFDDPKVLLAYHNAIVFDDDTTRPLHRAAEEHRSLAERPLPMFKGVNGLIQLFRADLRKYDHLWDQSVDHFWGWEILAHDQWYFFVALLLGKVEFVDQPLLGYRQHGSNTYGVRSSETWLHRLSQRFAHFAEQDTSQATAADSRAAIVEAIAELDNRHDLHEVAGVYRTFADRLRRRAATYSAPGVLQRAGCAARSLRAGDYRGGRWGFEKASIIRDLWSGVIRHKKIDPTGPSFSNG
mgnify:FL=1